MADVTIYLMGYSLQLEKEKRFTVFEDKNGSFMERLFIALNVMARSTETFPRTQTMSI